MKRAMLILLAVMLAIPAGFDYQMMYEDGTWEIYYENSENPSDYLWFTGEGNIATYCDEGEELNPRTKKTLWKLWRSGYQTRTGQALERVPCSTVE